MNKIIHPRFNRRLYLRSVLIASMVLFSNAFAVELSEIHTGPGRVPFNKATVEARKADTALTTVLIEFEQHVSEMKPSKDFKPSIRNARVARGKVLIDAEASGDGDDLFKDLLAIGLTRGSRRGSMVSGYLPLGLVRKMLALDSLRIASVSRAVVNAGTVVSQGDASMFADDARADFGVDGTGIMVGVISDSYNCLGDAANDQLNDDLPGDVVILDDSACGTDEGRAMMQIIHDVAPGANLAFHTAFNGIADFANGIEELAQAGADVIVDDVSYFFVPMFQDGVIAQVVDTVVAGDTAYFSSAGNSARNGYARPFDNSGEPLTVSGEYRGFLHDFDPGPGVDWEQAVTVPVESTIIICYQWDQPWGNATVDMDIYLHTSEGAALPGIVASSQTNNNLDRGGSGQPAECLQFTNKSLINSLFGGPDYKIMLAFFSSGPDEPSLANPPPPGLTINQQYIVFRGVSAPGITEYRTDSGTIFGHANAAGAEAVGAAFYDLNQSSPISCGEQRPPVTDASGSIRLECYSSAGSIPIYFDTSGNRLGSPEDRAKPNIVGPDGGNTTFFGFDIVNDPDGVPYASDDDDWPNFFGTSASAPHTAGVAALMLDAAPALGPGDVYEKLENTAIDMGPAGIDSDSGSGFIQADSAVAAALGGSPVNSPPVANNDSAETDEDVAAAIDVLANDSDPDNDTLAITNVTQGSDGTVSYAGKIVTYTPNSDFNGTDSFEYTVSDDGDLSDTATVNVTVNPINDGPIAIDDIAETDTGSSVVIYVLSNDTDPDGDLLEVNSVSIAENGTTSVPPSGAYVTYTPDTGFEGTDSFDYTVSDKSLTAAATVTVTVNPLQPLSCTLLYSDKRSCQNDSNCIWVGHPNNGACEEAGCTVSETPSELSCSDGLDNDCDGLVDSDDPDCPPGPPADCSTYDNSTDCKADGSCRWNRKSSACLAK